ncbi:P-loop NTPase fold protein [Reyranella sp.]|uniref:P-loop NTPase fold protein n=1 Tax=Reyranella sp. TaxID=1929291 RepID=UPI0011F519BE|nr:P-loop NTPase fold protein [Reyranella sp.]TAJ89324.1 MAG: hypothetical protein EPO50_02855 [Reyranella sp.]
MTDDPNRHVREYLDYYLDMKHPPKFAVMLKGPWGIGKSTLIREYLEKKHLSPSDVSDARSHSGPAYIYVSLFGIQSVEQVHRAIQHKVYPLLGSKAAKVATEIAKAAAKKLAVLPELSLEDLLGIPNVQVFVFDDLERCEMSSKALLGCINYFIEHLDRKVILVAHDEIYSDAAYLEQREKIVGQTLQMQPVLDSALPRFISSIEFDAARSFLERQSAELATVFRQSGTENLRVLQRSIWAYVRFFRCLAERHLKNERAMISALRLIMAWSLELRSGKLQLDDLRERRSWIELATDRHFNKGKSEGTFAQRAKYYSEVELGADDLSTDVLLEILGSGLFDSKKIQECLDRSSWFVTPEDEPAWRTVWYGFERDESVFHAAVQKMECEFAAREIVAPGIILHVFGLRLWLSSIGQLAIGEEEVAKECQLYLDDLYKAGRLEPSPFTHSLEDMNDGYDGLGFHAQGPRFSDLAKRLEELRYLARSDSYSKIGEELVGLMRSDSNLFFRRLCFTNSGESTYARVPVLSKIKPADFVSSILSLKPSAQKQVMEVFRFRYEAGQLDNQLAEEKAWVAEVRQLLEGESARLSPITRARIAKFIEWYMP